MKMLPKIEIEVAHSERAEEDSNLLVLSITKEANRAAHERQELQAALGLTIAELRTHDDYAVLAKKHHEIGTRNSLLGRQLTETVTAMTRGMAAYRHRRIEEQAVAIVDGRITEAFEGFEELQTRVTRLTEETRAYQQALRQVKGQMDEIKAERSIDAAAQAEPFHRQAATEIADAVEALIAALKKEEQIRRIVTDAGYDDRLPSFHGVIPRSTDNHVERFARRAREYRR